VIDTAPGVVTLSKAPIFASVSAETSLSASPPVPAKMPPASEVICSLNAAV
jgi:hypothetical protein